MNIGAQLRVIQANSAERFDKIYRGTMQEMGRRIIIRSPVKDGFFKANWLADYINDTSNDPARTNISYSEGRLKAKVNGLTSEKKFYFVNSMPYAKKLEEGSSDQAPSGMVKLTAREFESIASAEIAKVQ